MRLAEIMTYPVEVVTAGCSIARAADMMRRLDVGVLPVCDGSRIIGIVTDRDITVRATATGCDPNATPVFECMSSEIFFCYDDEESADAEELMQKQQVRRVPIVNRRNELVGIVALADLVTKTAETDEIDRTIWNISQPEKGQAA